jgi:DNA polymerase-3 subunit alpha
MADLKSSNLGYAAKGSYTVIGELAALREMPDKNGNKMAFGSLRDFEGEIDLLFFAKAWGENRDMLNLGEFVALKGSIDPASDRNPEKPSFKVSGIADLAALGRSAARRFASGEEPPILPRADRNARSSDAPESSSWETSQNQSAAQLQAIHIKLDSQSTSEDQGILPLRNYLSGNPGPCPVFIHVVYGSEKIIRTASGLSLAAEKEALGVLEGCQGVIKAWKEHYLE